MKIVQADETYLEQTASLFDQYRVFYQQQSDINAARAFINARFTAKDTVIYLAINEQHQGMGFTHLFPSFSSVAMQRTYVLNDLFVSADFRKQGVARALMNTAKAFAEKKDAFALKLATAKDNHAAKALYDQLGYKQIKLFDYYTLSTKK